MSGETGTPLTGGADRACLRVWLSPSRSAGRQGFGAELDMDELAALVRHGGILRHLFRYRHVGAAAEHLGALPRPFALSLLLRLMSRGDCTIEDAAGSRRAIGWGAIARHGAGYVRDLAAARGLAARVVRDVTELEALARAPARPIPAQPSRGARALAVRADLWLGVKAGGSVAHTAGIANAMAAEGWQPTLLAYEANPILDAGVDARLLAPPARFWDLPELPALAANADLLAALADEIARARPALLYARHAGFSYAAALAARRTGVPLVLEYNGSEVWIARHWGRPFRREALARRIEAAVLGAADRIATVSQPLTDELLARGIDRARVVTAPNGVDSGRFRPDLDGRPVRRRLGIPDAARVLGFIGSFSAWHGVPVLAEAYARLDRAAPARAAGTRLLLIGDGPERAAVEGVVRLAGLGSRVILTGAIPQAAAPAHLAAADVLIAPHVPNPDGSPFFGSPTKLYEYMAMGRPIVASRLGQIAEVLEDGVTALLAAPGDADDLARAVVRILGSPELSAGLARAARQAAVERHGWQHVLRRILAAPA